MNRNKGARRLGGFIMILAVTILACQSVSNFNPFVTATPTATATFTPSSTPTPTPTFTPTNTPTATFTPAPTLPPNGRMTKELPDGTTLFLDYDGSYQVIFPEGWVVIIMEDDDITRALDSLPDQDKSVSELIDALRKTSGSDLIRAIGVKSRAQQGLYAPNISIAYDKNPFSKAMSLQALIDATVEYYPSLKIRVIHSGIEKTSSGIEIGVIEIQWSAKITSSKTLNLRQKQILFKSGEGTVIITFSTTRDSKVNLDADLKLLIESIKLLD